MPTVNVRHAESGDLEALAALFDGYRQFYGRESDVAAARAFIGERLEAGDSVILVAELGERLAGFAQLYPSFTSVGMARIFILNDLFVSEDSRGTGAGRALLDAAADYGRTAGAVRLTLTTQKHNSTAKRAYEKAGWVIDQEFDTYNLRLAG